MEYALKNVPVTQYEPPEGVVSLNGEWYYNEYAQGAGIGSVGIQAPAASSTNVDKPTNPTPPSNNTQAPPATDERKRILDLFKN